jgi:hypothetical protein
MRTRAFSAFIAHGARAGLYEECLQRARIVVSPDILAELEEKLTAKAKLSAAESREVIRAVRADAEVVKATPLPKSQPQEASFHNPASVRAALGIPSRRCPLGRKNSMVFQPCVWPDVNTGDK